MNASDIGDMAKGYLDCAEWTSEDAENYPGEYQPEWDWAGEAICEAISECASFVLAHGDDVETAMADQPARTWDHIGHDFWLSRNGHGAGFFDRGRHPVWNKLQDAARAYGWCDAYLGDDGKGYLS